MKWVFMAIIIFAAGSLMAREPGDSLIVDTIDIYSIGLGVHYGFVFAHSRDVQNTKGSQPWALEVDLNRQLINNEAWSECKCYPRTGLVISYFNFDNKVLGYSLNAAWYVEPFINTSHRINFSMKGAAGISYLSNPYDVDDNPENMSYSTHLSAYLALGLGGNLKVNKHITAKVSAYYNHISNGGIKDPNKGINWPAATLQIFYIINPAPLPPKKSIPARDYRNRPLRKDIYLFVSQKDIYVIWGGGMTVSKQVSGMNAVTLCGEIVADYALKNKLQQDRLPDENYILPGLMAGHEFLMGKFNFSQQIGVYLTNPGPYYQAFYQRYGLSYSIGKSISIGINLKAHLQEANFLDGRLTYSFR